MGYLCLGQSVLQQSVLIFIFGQNYLYLYIIILCSTALGFGKIFSPAKIPAVLLQSCAGSGYLSANPGGSYSFRLFPIYSCQMVLNFTHFSQYMVA